MGQISTINKRIKYQTEQWLDFLVFSDMDDKSEVPSHNSLNVDNSVGRKRTHALFEKSRVIPVLWLSFICEWEGGWGGAPLNRTLKSSCALSLWAAENPAQ